jgi:excisionase family DNA binding protein
MILIVYSIVYAFLTIIPYTRKVNCRQEPTNVEREKPLLLTGNEVAAELGISRALAYRWMAKGVLPVVRVPGGRTVRVPRAALEAWIEQQTQPAGGRAA